MGARFSLIACGASALLGMAILLGGAWWIASARITAKDSQISELRAQYAAASAQAHVDALQLQQAADAAATLERGRQRAAADAAAEAATAKVQKAAVALVEAKERLTHVQATDQTSGAWGTVSIPAAVRRVLEGADQTHTADTSGDGDQGGTGGAAGKAGRGVPAASGEPGHQR